jgi:hypothetical protein
MTDVGFVGKTEITDKNKYHGKKQTIELGYSGNFIA